MLFTFGCRCVSHFLINSFVLQFSFLLLFPNLANVIKNKQVVTVICRSCGTNARTRTHTQKRISNNKVKVASSSCPAFSLFIFIFFFGKVVIHSQTLLRACECASRRNHLLFFKMLLHRSCEKGSPISFHSPLFILENWNKMKMDSSSS